MNERKHDPQKFTVLARALSTQRNGDTWRTEVVISTGAEARDGNIWDQSTWDLRDYERNPVVLYNHDASGVVVGRGVDVRVEDGSLRGAIEWDVGDHNPDATRLAIQYERGFMSAVSARIDTSARFVHRSQLPDGDDRKSDSGYLVQGLRLLEFSPVTIPADTGAVAIRSEPDPDDLAARVRHILRTDPEVRAIIRAAPLSEPAGDWFAGLDRSQPEKGTDWFADLATEGET